MAAAPPLSEQLHRLLSTEVAPKQPAEELDSAAGPSDADLAQLEAELSDVVAKASAAMSVQSASALEASALVTRAPEQVSVAVAGPSLLSLVPSSAAPARTARVRQARRAARNGYASGATADQVAAGAGRGKAIGKDGTNQFLHRTAEMRVMEALDEREVMEVCRDFLFLDKLRRQCEKTLHRQATDGEVAEALGMDTR